MQLSPHFEVREFLSPGRATIPAGYRAELRQLCLMYLEPLRERWGPVRIHSGFRTAMHNEQVGGAPLSRHLNLAGAAGAAADLSCRRGRPIDWYRTLDALHIGGLGLYVTHVHADTRRGRARW